MTFALKDPDRMERMYKRLGGESIRFTTSGGKIEKSQCLHEAPSAYLFDQPAQLRSVDRVVRVISSKISAKSGGRVFVGDDETEYEVVDRKAVADADGVEGGDAFESLLLLGSV